jgi:ABC-type multidrug transport system fused ATPase/permease subunit
MQDSFLFSGDIVSNIRLKSTEISEEEVMKASEFVNADSFIRSLDGDYHAHVAERGCTFSAGQRQLISFARAIVSKPSILVLDEATANIDTETELVIQDALGKLQKGRTSLTIAHRLSTIKSADKIIVINKGRIKEMGNHEELMANGGMYSELYNNLKVPSAS